MKRLILTATFILLFVTSAFAKVNINTATAKELTELPGIGTAKATAIVSYRETNGPFSSPDDLKKVKGIGDKIYQQIQQEITTK